MICYFCNENCSYLFSYTYKCYLCNVEYYTGNLGLANMYFEKEDIYFQFNLIPKPPKSIIVSKNGDIIATFNYMINISPQNINEKLKTYILFS